MTCPKCGSLNVVDLMNGMSVCDCCENRFPTYNQSADDFVKAVIDQSKRETAPGMAPVIAIPDKCVGPAKLVVACGSTIPKIAVKTVQDHLHFRWLELSYQLAYSRAAYAWTADRNDWQSYQIAQASRSEILSAWNAFGFEKGGLLTDEFADRMRAGYDNAKTDKGGD